jgi:hypothetical protein
MKTARALAVIGAVAAALALAGCGGGSPARHAVTSPGARNYSGPGFEFAIPAGWKLAARNTGPTGVSGASFQAPNHRATIAVHVYTHPSETVPQAIADDVAGDTVEAQAYSRFRVLKRRLQTGSVSGARQSEELVETYLDPSGTARYDDLVVLMPSGAMVDVEVVASSRYSTYDPAATTGSFHLVSTG